MLNTTTSGNLYVSICDQESLLASYLNPMAGRAIFLSLPEECVQVA